jgi:hypothetical protein
MSGRARKSVSKRRHQEAFWPVSAKWPQGGRSEGLIVWNELRGVNITRAGARWPKSSVRGDDLAWYIAGRTQGRAS